MSGLRVLVVTKIFPHANDPVFAPPNRQQFAALGRRCHVEVLGTIPWFPGARAFGRWSQAGRLAAVPRQETIEGLAVEHPRFLFVPRVAVGAQWALYAASLAPEILKRRGQFDVLLGSWIYPDGVAAVVLARLLGVPAVIKVHGSDVHVIARIPGAARSLRWALPHAARVVAVSRALADEVAALGMPRERVDVVPNGVNGELFFPADRAEARRALGAADDRRRWIVYVGRMETPKGVADLLEAFALLAARRDDLRLIYVGDGAARPAIAAGAARLGDRVLVAGARPLAEVPRWMAACDLLCLPSWNEGTPNVVLEALACGRRVVATRVGGVPDVLTGAELGAMVEARDVAALAEVLGREADRAYDPAAVARAGARGGWDESAARLEESLRRAVLGSGA